MKNLSLLSIATLLLSSGCVLSITDDLATDTTVDTTADDDVDDDATDDATEEATDDATEDTGDGDTTDDAEDDVDTTDETTADTTADDTTDTGPAGMCGWNADGPYYDCGFEGADPGGTFPLECPDGLTEGAPCADSGLTGEGCCDANGDNWYCAEGEVVFFNACS
jgi:hypothetical protein